MASGRCHTEEPLGPAQPKSRTPKTVSFNRMAGVLCYAAWMPRTHGRQSVEVWTQDKVGPSPCPHSMGGGAWGIWESQQHALPCGDTCRSPGSDHTGAAVMERLSSMGAQTGTPPQLEGTARRPLNGPHPSQPRSPHTGVPCSWGLCLGTP